MLCNLNCLLSPEYSRALQLFFQCEYKDIAAIVHMVKYTYVEKEYLYICYTSQYRYIRHVKIVHHIGLTIAAQSWWRFLRDILIIINIS